MKIFDSIFGKKQESQFPTVDWFCDNCDDHLNEQEGFSDWNSIWQCKRCGYMNCISENNIIDEFESDDEEPDWSDL